MLIGLTGNHRKGYNIRALIELIGNKIDREGSQHVAAGVPCFPADKMEQIIPEKTIHIAILTVPPESAVQTAMLLQQAGIKGILNFTSVHLDVTPEIYLKNYDIITSLEEIGLFI